MIENWNEYIDYLKVLAEFNLPPITFQEFQEAKEEVLTK